MIELKKIRYKGQEIDFNDLEFEWEDTSNVSCHCPVMNNILFGSVYDYSSARFDEGYNEGYAEAEMACRDSSDEYYEDIIEF